MSTQYSDNILDFSQFQEHDWTTVGVPLRLPNFGFGSLVFYSLAQCQSEPEHSQVNKELPRETFLEGVGNIKQLLALCPH